ncbi:MAG: C15orf41 family protein [archaeon]|nr:C15orf41 family protein [archaeon]
MTCALDFRKENVEYQEYRKLYSRLNSVQDVYRCIEEGHDPNLIKVLFTQKVNRDVKKRFYIVKKKVKQLLERGIENQSIVDIALRFNFPPVLIAMFIFQERGVSKRGFWKCVEDPYGTLDMNTAKIVEEAVEKDLVYSPAASEEGRRRGIYGENLLHLWLNRQGIEYRTEKDLKGICKKTPDVLFDQPLECDGKRVCWVESKAAFGDNIEVSRDSKKQLIPYTEAFGPGIVVYWAGYIDGVVCPEGVQVCDASITCKALHIYQQ